MSDGRAEWLPGIVKCFIPKHNSRFMEIKHVFDLSATIRTNMPVWPTNPLPAVTPVGIKARDGYNVESYSSLTHSGTHVDAPYHMLEEGLTVDSLELDRLVGECYCINIVPDGKEITAEVMASAWKEEYDGRMLLINTGWSARRSFSRTFLYDFPGLSLDAASFIVSHGVRTVGIDTLSIEPYEHSGFEVHQMLMGKDIVIIEDMAGLGQLMEGRKYLLVAAPLKIGGGSGAMARVLALDVY